VGGEGEVKRERREEERKKRGEGGRRGEGRDIMPSGKVTQTHCAHNHNMAYRAALKGIFSVTVGDTFIHSTSDSTN
jgi:hypothetical protein